jgi:small ligand-binding sensory domain FIST
MQPATRLVQELSEAYPGAPLIGGLASGAHKPGENRLFLDGEIYDEGAVGVALSGPVVLRSIVSQGCKPIGEPLVITRAEKNIIFEVAGQPPMQVLQELLPKLPARDQRLARHALFIGRVINEYQEEFGRGDFLIRNLIGTDPKSGALAIGDWIRTGQTVQFQIRDGQTAHEDLKAMLEKQRGASPAEPPRGVVLFSCLGRGENMYGAPDHDISAIHEHLGAVPTAGFFCNGEIGPVGERAFVHGFTSVIGLFGERPVEK